MARWRSPLAIMRWLLSSERLDDVPDTAPVRATEPGPPRQGFVRWLISTEELPQLDSTTDEARPRVGLLRFIFSFERLPDTADAGTTHRSGGHDA